MRYHPGEDRRHLLDIFPAENVSNALVIVFVHCGAWVIGDKNFFGL